MALFAGLFAALAIALSGCGGGSTVKTRGGADLDGAAYPPGVTAHDFALTDQHGRSVTLSDYRGHVVALTFLSSDCRACTLVAQQIRGALDELGSPPYVTTIFVSTDPRLDTPTKVRRFLGDVSLTGRVEYLSGAETRLRSVWRTYHVTPVSAGAHVSEAATTVLLIDRHGEIRVGFGLEQITPEGLAHDIDRLQGG